MSIRADVDVIRFEYEVGKVDEKVWLLESVSLADPITEAVRPYALLYSYYSILDRYRLTSQNTRLASSIARSL